MFGKQFQIESDLLDRAAISPEGRKALVEYLRPFVEKIVQTYIKEHGISDFNEDEVIASSWTYLDQAVRNYRKHRDEMVAGNRHVYYFSTYFAWYVRQGLLEYLEAKGSGPIL